MNTMRGIVASTIAAGFAVSGFATPAWAEDGPVEVYTFNWDSGGTPKTWTVTLCGEKCFHVVQTGEATEPWEADGYLLNGYITMFVVDRPDMITCPDGTQVAGSATYDWDDSLAGVATVANSGECGDTPGLISNPFTLTRIA